MKPIKYYVDFIKENWKRVIIIILVVIIAIMAISLFAKNNKISKLESENNISSVLLDSLTTYKNKLGIEVAQKKAFSVKYKDLEKSYEQLDSNSKLLVDNINSLKRENRKLKVATSAIVDQEVEVSDVVVEGEVNSIDSTITFKDSTKYFQYDLMVRIRQPTATLTVNELLMPNKLSITHTFNTKKTEARVMVTNSNKYFKTNDISAYVIPMNKCKKISPRKYIIIGGIGVGIGLTTALILLN